MEIEEPSIQPTFRVRYFWKSVSYTEDVAAQSIFFRLPHNNIDVKFRLLAQRFQNPHVTVIHVQVKKFCMVNPYGEADITITLSDGCSKTERISDWYQDSSVFCFSTTIGHGEWHPDIQCDIDWYRFLSMEEWKNVLNKKTDLSLKKLLFSPRGSDVRFVVGDQILPAHKFVIEHHSPALCATFKQACGSRGKIILRMHNIDVDTMKEILQFLYTDSFLVDDVNTWTSVVVAAMSLKFYKIHKYCYSKIIRFANSRGLLDGFSFPSVLDLFQNDNRFIM